METSAASGPVAPAGGSGRERGRPSRRRVARTAIVVAALGLLMVVGWLGVRAYQAATALRSAADGVVRVRDDVADGRTAGLPDAVRQVRADAARAVEATSDPVWWLAERLPVVGRDAVAVRIVADAVDVLATEALTPLATLAGELDLASLGFVDGRLDTAPLVAAQPALDRAAQATTRVRESVDAVDPDRLHGPLPDAVADLQSRLADADATLVMASRLAALLPPMVGADEPRHHLLLFLNSAELRAQGGIIGALAVITAEDGRLTLTDQVSSQEMPKFDEAVLPLTDAELQVATDVVGRRIQNPVMLPDTPRVGEIVAEMWRRARGQVVDGVIAVDPVALSYVLAATGDVHHPGGEILSADTLVRTLLYTVYARQADPAESDAFFAGAASAAFAALASGAGDTGALLDALQRSTAERRLSVWSAHPAEERLISGTAIDGALLSGGHDGAVGIFLDNTSGWKTDTFLRSAVTVESVRCAGDSVELELALELTNTLPADARELPYYVVGDGSTGVPVGSMRMRVSAYSPVGGDVVEVRRDDAFVGASGATMAGRAVRVMTETLAPGETARYRFTVTAPARAPEIPIWTTPTTSTPGYAQDAQGCAA